MKSKVLGLAVGLLALTAGVAAAAGLWAGIPPVFPVGTTGSQVVNGVTVPSSAYNVLPLTGAETAPFDTGKASGSPPQTEVISVNQLTAYVRAPVTLTDATTIASDASVIGQGGLAIVTLTASGHTIATPSNLTSGEWYNLLVKQDGTGSRTVTWAAIFRFPGGTAPTLTTAANAVDQFSFVYDGTKFRQTSQNLND